MLVARREERKITVRVVILIEQLINQELHDGEITECGASFTVPIFPLIDPPVKSSMDFTSNLLRHVTCKEGPKRKKRYFCYV